MESNEGLSVHSKPFYLPDAKPGPLLSQKRGLKRAEHLLRCLGPESVQIESLLDVGCSSGEVTYQFAVELRVAKTYGADIYPAGGYQPPPVAQECEEEWPGSRMTYVEIDTHKCLLDLPDKSVQLVTCVMSMHHFRDFGKMLSEIKRVLMPDGYLFVREHDVPASKPKLAHKLSQMHTKFKDHRPEEPIYFWGRRELRIELNRSGFAHVRDSDFKEQETNYQAIYHSLFRAKDEPVFVEVPAVFATTQAKDKPASKKDNWRDSLFRKPK